MRNKMNQTWLLLVVFTFLLSACEDQITSDDHSTGRLMINELLASNDTTNQDEFGEFDDWIELYNGSDETIDIGGMHISDDPMDSTVWIIPDDFPEMTVLLPGDFLLLWCDDEPEQGVRHLDFKLSSGGETVYLWQADGATIIDSVDFGAQATGVSFGRDPDDVSVWRYFSTPTPSAANQ